MASATQSHSLSVEQYLCTPFRPDVDYVDLAEIFHALDDV